MSAQTFALLSQKSSFYLAPCPDPGRPHQGNRLGDDFRHGKSVTFTCPKDYLREGVRSITCSDGRWSNRTPSCKGKCYMLSERVKGFLHLSPDSLLSLIHAFITSRLDLCSGLLYGLPKPQILKIQRVQNAAARLAINMGKYSRVTQTLQDLHLLPVCARIHFKILILVFKAIHGLSPRFNYC